MHLVHMERARDLTDLPNITIVLGEALKRAGIASIAELAILGAERAWERLCAASAQPDAHILLAPKGAIAGLLRRDLPRTRRGELLRARPLHQPRANARQQDVRAYRDHRPRARAASPS